jgi:hypothetical protein
MFRYAGIPLRLFALAEIVGFEPTNYGVKVQCLTSWLYPMVPLMGFEPICQLARDFKSPMSTNSIIVAYGGPSQDRTEDLSVMSGRL